MVRRLLRLVAATLAVLALLTQAAWANSGLETSTTLSTSAATPTEVTVGVNSLTIRVWATEGNVPTGKSGLVDVVTSYSMATSGTITAGSSTTTIDFPNINYSHDCPTTGTIPQGCLANPFVVTASLTVASGTPAET